MSSQTYSKSVYKCVCEEDYEDNCNDDVCVCDDDIVCDENNCNPCEKASKSKSSLMDLITYGEMDAYLSPEAKTFCYKYTFNTVPIGSWNCSSLNDAKFDLSFGYHKPSGTCNMSYISRFEINPIYEATNDEDLQLCEQYNDYKYNYDSNNAIKICKESISKGYTSLLDKYLESNDTTLSKYAFLKSLESDNKKILDAIDKYKTDHTVKCYINKCKILSRKETCLLCLDDDIDCIPTECAHFYCYDCYVNLNAKCTIC